MALYPKNTMGQDTLSPGARGEIFQADLPGYRNQGDRINRTNNQLETGVHDTPNTKWELDRRLPAQFRYGFAHGYNQIVIPKGRIVAVDPNMNQLDFDTKKALNVLTLANGGNLVKLNDKTWEIVKTNIDKSGGEGNYKIVTEDNKEVGVDPNSGLVTIDGEVKSTYRPANKPLGIIYRNEYTRDDDAFNGLQPGAVKTDSIVELPLFLTKDKAIQNPWGSAYGPQILPGDLLKSDEDGRFIVSPLSRPLLLVDMSPAEIEFERQQVIGQVINVNRDLLPAGAARFAQWALSDRMNFDRFNPEMWRVNNRTGEDINEDSPYKANGGGAVNNETSLTGVDPFEPQGYPYDQTMTQHDLHMLASTARRSDLRMGLEYQLENGIPGLTDGYNAYSKQYPAEKISEIGIANNAEDYTKIYCKLSQVDVEANSVYLAVTSANKNVAVFSSSPVVQGATLDLKIADKTLNEAYVVEYINEKQGFVVLAIKDTTAYQEFITNEDVQSALGTDTINVYAKFNKRGLSGVPTFLDWDGCQGTVQIVLQK